MLRGQRAQGAKQEGTLSVCPPQHRASPTAASRSERRTRRRRGAAGNRCSLSPGFWTTPDTARTGLDIYVSDHRDRGRQQSSLD
ncbi:hypothetical protein PFLUV_G00019050 [Perca fluviatilis]|uniref:Uncharacterized protein n=1 Tax=Perca fluviatilis TaxID=8168 RepID=A0A6A5FLR3_PERFL|nr:hypothetical protein PFLUV_G00019050 [Perca fluviatilis]